MGATREKGMRAVDGTLESTLMLETGTEIAWVYRSKAGVTTGVTAVHRVLGGGKTYCSATIPDASHRFPALRSLNACSACERLFKRATAAEGRS